jgi:hypothetical protein
LQLKVQPIRLQKLVGAPKLIKPTRRDGVRATFKPKLRFANLPAHFGEFKH